MYQGSATLDIDEIHTKHMVYLMTYMLSAVMGRNVDVSLIDGTCLCRAGTGITADIRDGVIVYHMDSECLCYAFMGVAVLA
jgi:hypothetical protein